MIADNIVVEQYEESSVVKNEDGYIVGYVAVVTHLDSGEKELRFHWLGTSSLLSSLDEFNGLQIVIAILRSEAKRLLPDGETSSKYEECGPSGQ
jgi:hypothetical protein